MNVLVTGGAGFIGSNTVAGLLEQGHEVRVLDDLSTGNTSNLKELKVEFVEGTITDSSTVKKAVDGMEFVIHEAALPSVSRSIKNPARTNDVNVMGTLNVLVASRDGGVKRVVCASSSSVYGDLPKLPKVENMEPRPKSPYAVSKLAAEHYCKVFYDLYGLETLSLRYFNVFGPRQDPHSEYAAVIPKFIDSVLNDKRPTVFGDGEQSRDFTYVRNVVGANILALKAGRCRGDVINIACGERTTLNELIGILGGLIGKKVNPGYAEPRPGDVKHSLADISLAKRILGYKPAYNLETGLEETIEWYRKAGQR